MAKKISLCPVRYRLLALDCGRLAYRVSEQGQAELASSVLVMVMHVRDVRVFMG
jgi:hypothetical protein